MLPFILFFLGISGATIKIDKYGDSEGNFSVVALKPYNYTMPNGINCSYGMVPVAYFQQGDDIPVSESSFFLFLN